MKTAEEIDSMAAAGVSMSRAMLEAMLDAAREGVLVVDPSTRITAANRAAAATFARRDETLAGKRISEVIRNAPLHEAFQRAVQIGASADLRVELTDTEKHSFDVHIAPIVIDGAVHAIGLFYDTTQIERLERVRQEFLSNISHELRTPLTAILAFVETLEDGAIDDKENNRRFLGVIRRNAERMHALIADILELSLIESGKVSIDTKQVTLSHLVQEVFASISAKAKANSISLVSDIDAAESIPADPTRLDQILTNLIDNAVKFNRPGGSVTVALERRGDLALISVTDTGEGISAEHLQRIFERFYRADRGRTREIGGTGLGLAIVKHLARLHGGEVSVRSELGRGSAFTVELPL